MIAVPPGLGAGLSIIDRAEACVREQERLGKEAAEREQRVSAMLAELLATERRMDLALAEMLAAVCEMRMRT